MNYNDYKGSRDLTWQLLIDNNITELPVKVSAICKAQGIRIISYSQARTVLKAQNLLHHCKENDGFTVSGIIFYNDSCTIGRQRFTVAHELGHILLHHTGDLINREPSPTDNPIEQAANVFASRLLAPACVLHACGVTKAEEIANMCNISVASARYRMMRLDRLYERERQFLATRGRSCFMLSPLERKVCIQFSNYIITHRCRPS